MTAIDQIRELLHLAAGALIWPVLVSLLGLAALTLIAIGAYLREAFDRFRGTHRRLKAALIRLDEVANAAGGCESVDIALERVLQDEERRFWRGLTRLRLAVRVGPALGLMGTLIPMALALKGLSEGNLPALASNMVTAFAATVVGLCISVLSYLMASSQEAWVQSDTQALSFRAEALLRATNANERGA